MKVCILGTAERMDDGSLNVPLSVGKPPNEKIVNLPIDLQSVGAEAALNSSEPVRIPNWVASGKAWFLFRGKLVQVTETGQHSEEEMALEVANFVLKRERRYQHLRRQLDAFKNMDRADSERRERIPESVRLFVWQRDQGRCAACGSLERLEFDHIVPIARGGSNSERNIQLLCEQCNRQKGGNV